MFYSTKKTDYES